MSPANHDYEQPRHREEKLVDFSFEQNYTMGLSDIICRTTARIATATARYSYLVLKRSEKGPV
jgi:hypothetical protein